MKGAKPRVFLGGDLHAKHRGRYVFQIGTIRTVVKSHVDMKYYRICTMMWKQKGGVAIGGRLSQAILEAVLASEEHGYDVVHHDRLKCVGA